MRNRWLLGILGILIVVTLAASLALPASAAPTASTRIHVVQRGETLSTIAQRYGVSTWDLARANGITNPNHIYVGQRLVIPAASSGKIVHIVQWGETLTRIAIRYGVDAWTIARANGLTNLNHIYAGQRLVIPRAAPPPPPPAPPQPSTPTTWPGPWTGEYFDNLSLSGSAYATRTDAKINFDWGWGPPAGGMPTNAFAVRWSGTFYFDGGTYRLYARVDDGVRVYVDDEQVIFGWRDGGLRTYTADKALAAGNHTIRVEYYDRIQVARVYFWYKKISGTGPAPAPEPTPAPGPEPAPGAGWLGEYYNGQNLSGSPVATRYDAWIGFDWGTNSPLPDMWQDHFSIRWTSQVHLNTDHYRFCTTSDDGVRLWVGEDLVVDAWHGNNRATHCSVHWVQSGTYPVKVEYYEDGGNALIYVWWEPH